MRLYEIDEAILALLEGAVDPDTGEVNVDTEALEALQMERERKLEGVALYIKELAAEAKAIREEEILLAKRRKAKEARIERLTRWLLYALDGVGMETPRVRLTVHKGAQKAQINEREFLPWAMEECADMLRFGEPEINRKLVTDALKQGLELPGCTLVREQSLIIK